MKTQNTMLKFGLTVFASLVLAACGGSGGGNGESAQVVTNPTTSTETTAQTETTSTETAATTPTTTDETATPATEETAAPATPQPTVTDNNTIVVGYGFALPKDGSPIQSSVYTMDKRAISYLAKNKIEVEGKIIEVLPTSNSDAFFSRGLFIQKDADKDGIKRVVNGNDYNYTRWGYIEGNEESGLANAYLFALGSDATKNMPTSGTAVYKGDAVHLYADDGSNTLNQIVAAAAEFNVDFQNNTLSGKITPNRTELNAVNFNADINGNQFSTAEDSATLAKGGFYGSNANELTGTYTNNSEQGAYFGAFGAKK